MVVLTRKGAFLYSPLSIISMKNLVSLLILALVIVLLVVGYRQWREARTLQEQDRKGVQSTTTPGSLFTSTYPLFPTPTSTP